MYLSTALSHTFLSLLPSCTHLPREYIPEIQCSYLRPDSSNGPRYTFSAPSLSLDRSCTKRRVSSVRGRHRLIFACPHSMQIDRSKKKLTIKDMRLPWRPIYDLLSHDLFLPRRQFDIGFISFSWSLGSLADHVLRSLTYSMGVIAEFSR